MLKTYEVMIKDGQVMWLDEKPDIKLGRAFITIFEEEPVMNTDETPKPIRRRFPVPSLAGKAKTLGDIVSPMVDEADWECLK